MIIRKIKVNEYEYQPPINYVAGATEPDIQFQLTDYVIPSGAEARAYVQRFDGSFEYTVATIDDQTITIAPTTSMFSVKGEGAIQVTLYVGDEVVKNFSVPVFVHADLADDAAQEGRDIVSIFRSSEEEAIAQFQEDAEEVAAEVIETIPHDYTALSNEVDELNERLGDVKSEISEDEITKVIHDFCRLRIWDEEDGFKTFNARLSCVAPIHCPFDIYIDANDVTDKMGLCTLLFFSADWAHPSTFVRSENILIGRNGRNIVKIPANTYCCFQLAQADNSNFSSQTLGENIKVSFTPQIDENLNTTGAAADANATGIAIHATEAEIENSKNSVIELISESIVKEINDIGGGLYSPDISLQSTIVQYRWLAEDSGIATIGESYPDWYIAHQIPIRPFTFYCVNGSAQYYGHAVYQILDADGNIIAQEYATSSDVLTLNNKVIYTPYNAASIRVASINGAEGATVYSTEYTAKKGWDDKKWVCIGDSLTENNIRTTMHYHDYIAEKTGIQVINLGKGGTGYKRSYAGEGPFIDRVNQIPIDADVVTIFGSGNDGIYEIGNPSDTGTDTLCSAINETIESIYNRIPTCNLAIITPCPWDAYNPADDTNWMARYSAAIVQVCKNWGIPCLDLYHCSSLRPWDATFRAAAYSKDDGNGVHPDETGHKLIAPRFEELLNSLLIR